METHKNIALFALRIITGWYFFYAGISKVLNPAWSSAGYLSGAKTFPGFFGWLASPANIGWVDFLNEWGLVLVGAALLLGLATRFAAVAGGAMLFLYYLPVLDFPIANTHGYIVDDHIVAIAALCVVSAFRAGRKWGIDALVHRTGWGGSKFIRFIS